MIATFKNKDLKRLFEQGELRRIDPKLVLRLQNVLAALNEAISPKELLSIPGWRLHQLKGDLQGHWSISVSGNWRVVFRFEGRHVHDVDLTDYH